jgi:FXSXX-COOH protein
MSNSEAELRSDLLDLTGVDFDRLAELPGSALVNSLRRILEENENGLEQYASFQNNI